MKRRVIVSSLLVLVCFSLVWGTNLSGDTIKIQELVVTGNRIEVDKLNAPLSISLISSEEIKNHEESNILPVIAKLTPNVFVSEIGVSGYGLGNGTSGQITIRGIGGTPNAQILTLVDGQPQYMGIFGHPLPNFHMASNVERVEVVRGPASLLYGSNAMGGVMNIITKERKDNGLALSGHLAYGSFSTMKGGANVSYSKGKFSGGVSYNHDQTEGHRDTSAFNMNNVHVFAEYKLNSHWGIGTNYTMADYSFEDPGSIENPMSVAFLGDIRRNMATFSVKNNYERMQGGVFAFYNWGEHIFSDAWESTDESIGVNMYEALNVWNGGRLTIGGDFKRYGGIGSSGMNANVDLSVNEMAAYLVAEQKFDDKLILNAGARFERHSTFGGELVPQFGITYKPFQGSAVKGLVSKGFRSPTIMELYLFKANPDLGPERLINYELSFAQGFGSILRVELTAFMINGANMITEMPNSNPGPPMIWSNSGEFKNMGIELESSFYPSESIRMDLSYSLLNCDVDRLFAPKNQFYTSLSYKLGKLNLSVSLKTISGLYSFVDHENPENNIQEAYQLLDAKVRYQLFDFLEVYIAGKNILNQSYQTILGYTMPGINGISGLSFRF